MLRFVSRTLLLAATLCAAIATAHVAPAAPATISGTQAVNGHALATSPTALACKRNYYKNVDGRCVHRPSSDPRGATARCRDGSYSYSQHARGTCSHHGGVARWIHHP